MLHPTVYPSVGSQGRVHVVVVTVPHWGTVLSWCVKLGPFLSALLASLVCPAGILPRIRRSCRKVTRFSRMDGA